MNDKTTKVNDVDYNEYQRLALRTAKRFPTYEMELLYYGLGLVGEATEVMKAAKQGDGNAIQKELGDTLWYTAVLADKVKLSMVSVWDATRDYEGDGWDAIEVAEDLCIAAGRVGERIKKIVRDDLPVDQAALQSSLASVLGTALSMTEMLSVRMTCILEGNIEKLRARYPKGVYDAADAQARADGEVMNE